MFYHYETALVCLTYPINIVHVEPNVNPILKKNNKYRQKIKESTKMPHILSYTTDPSLATGPDIAENETVSPAAKAIFDAYFADGRITGITESEPDANTGTYDSEITFIDEATCDAYLSEMEAIDEFSKSGGARSNGARRNVD